MGKRPATDPIALELQHHWPRLSPGQYEITSPQDQAYNCIAWAAGDNSRWWEPSPYQQLYWPEEAPREFTIAALTVVYSAMGYRPCNTAEFEPGFEKVAIFGHADGTAAHAARQLSDGRWTSKLGRFVDISHHLGDLCNEEYGQVRAILRRRTRSAGSFWRRIVTRLSSLIRAFTLKLPH